MQLEKTWPAAGNDLAGSCCQNTALFDARPVAEHAMLAEGQSPKLPREQRLYGGVIKLLSQSCSEIIALADIQSQAVENSSHIGSIF